MRLSREQPRRQSADPALPARELAAAFEVFNRASRELEASYAGLERQLAQLSLDLAESRSERLRELAAKERLAAQLSGLLAELPGGVVVLDSEGRVLEANPRATQLVGHPLTGALWGEVSAWLRPAEGAAGEFVTGAGLRLAMQRSRLADQGESIILLTDITESHRLREAQTRRERLVTLGEMAARLAHQIRTPLSSALLYVSHLEDSRLAPQDALRLAGRLRHGLGRVEHLVEDMLLYIRGDRSEPVEFALEAVLEDIQHIMEPHLHNSGARLLVEAETQLRLRGNPLALSNTLCNLIDNSLHAKATSIRLHTARRGGTAEIRVADDGPGIAEELRERVFEPFFSTRRQGTGLGLAVAASTLQAFGGSITIEAATGCSLLLRIPLAATETAAAGQGLSSTQRGTSDHG